MTKRFTMILLAFAVIFLGILVVTKHKAGAPTGNNANSSQLTNHTVGAGKSGVTLTEYGDFACPACYAYYPLVEQVKQKYGDQITFQFRNFPLVELHKNALIGARAAEAASLQGKFWEMYQQLYENQPNWRESNSPQQFFDQFANQIGLNLDKFHEDMKSEQVNNFVQADRAEAQKLGFSGTPSFLLDGKQIDSSGVRTIEDFSKLIDAAIKAKQNH